MIKFLFHFLGSVYFALAILISMIFFVTTGTFLESYANSHLFAAKLTYNSPLFTALLWMMFVNILLAALRRWPFKKRHFPFLLTHLGLLMILGGCLIKSYYGTQGQMLIVEGSGNDEIMMPNTYELVLEDKEGHLLIYPLDRHHQVRTNNKLKVIGYYPHHKSNFKLWPGNIDGWTVVNVQTDNLDIAVEEELFKNLNVRIIDRKSGKVIDEKPKFTFDFENQSLISENGLEIPLSGSMSLMTLNYNNHLLGSPQWIVEFDHPAVAVIAQNSEGDYSLVAIDHHGQIKKDELSSLVVYDRGFGGCSLQSSEPISLTSETGIEKEKRHIESLKKVLKEAPILTPPLELIRSGCRQTQFADTCLNFLIEWDLSNQWVLPLNHSLPIEIQELINALDWSLIPKDQLKSSYFASLLLMQLKENSLIEQLFLISSDLPEPPDIRSLDVNEKARILTVLLRAYGLHLKGLIPLAEVDNDATRFEFPATLQFEPKIPSKQLEENLPLLVVEFEDGSKSAIGYDRNGHGLKWPVLDNRYLLYFRPKIESLPYHIRLREARELKYPESSQPFSFESDIIVSNIDGTDPHEVTLSMNHVYETWDGYRFYLAGIHSENESRAKKVQIVVNHDPARYRLTYPGGIIVAIGIILLFWRPISIFG